MVEVAIKSLLSALSFTGSTSFTNNSAVHGGEIHKLHSTLNIVRKLIPECGGGIQAVNSTLDFTGNITFRNNSASFGGGIDVSKSSLNITGNKSFVTNLAQ